MKHTHIITDIMGVVLFIANDSKLFAINATVFLASYAMFTLSRRPPTAELLPKRRQTSWQRGEQKRNVPHIIKGGLS